MTEFDQPTISFKEVGPCHSIKPLKSNNHQRSYWGLLSNFGTIAMLLLAIGWGAWKFNGTSTNIEDEETIGDLDGFDSAPPFVKPPAANVHSTAQLGESVLLPPLDPDDRTNRNLGQLNAPLTTETSDSASVWLNGTIEKAEPIERIELPTRLSGGSNESTILR